jgi:hypothetical protein
MELPQSRYAWPMDWFWRYLFELSEIALPGKNKGNNILDAPASTATIVG